MNFENLPPQNKAGDEAEKAHAEYSYAQEKEGIDYGERPNEESEKEAEHFIESLQQLNPDWEGLDFSTVDFKHIESLSDEGERIDYVINQLIGLPALTDSQKDKVEVAKGLFKKNKGIIEKMSGVATVAAVLAFVVGGIMFDQNGREKQKQSDHTKIATAIESGKLTINSKEKLRHDEEHKIAMLLTTHPELHFTVNLSSSVDQEDTSGEAEVYITATRGNHSERFEGAASESKSDFEMKYILGEGHKNLSDFGATMKENRLRSSAIDQAIESFDKEG